MSDTASGAPAAADVVWPNDAAVCTSAADLIAPFEAFRSRPYLCPAKVWTIGYGTTFYPDDRRVGAYDPPIGETTAKTYLRADVGRKWAGIKHLLRQPPSVGQAAAMVSLAYNIGAGGFAKSSVLAAFNAGDLAHAAEAFLAYDKAHVDGQVIVLAGLKRRREAERALFLKSEAAA
jgi:lysozyme